MGTNTHDDDSSNQSTVNRIIQVAQMAGIGIATPILQSFIQDKVVDLVNQKDPNDLQQLIEIQYPLVQEDLDDDIKNGLSRIGPEFDDQIKNTLNPESILHWLDNPEEYIDATENEYEQIRECADVIREAPQGRQWLVTQVIELWEIAGVVGER